MLRMRHVGSAAGHLAGALLWLVAIGTLRSCCVFDTYLLVDRIGMRSIDETFSRNLLGEIALYVDRGRCERTYLYTARRYRAPAHSGDPGADWESVRLTSLVDLATWQMTGEASISTSYSDARHRYVLWTFSEEVFLVVEDR